MGIQNKTTLKGYFNTGDTPTEAQFHDLIDTTSNSFHSVSNYGTAGTQADFTAALAAGARYLIIDQDYTFGDSVLFDSTDAYVLKPVGDVTITLSSFTDTNELTALNGKNRVAAFHVRAANFKIDDSEGTLTIAGNQQVISASTKYVNGVLVYGQCDNVHIAGVTGSDVHNTVMLYEDSETNGHMENVIVERCKFVNAPTASGFSNACLDSFGVKNLHFHDLYSIGAEECVDVNGNCDTVHGNFFAENCTQSAIEVNNSQHVYVRGEYKQSSTSAGGAWNVNDYAGPATKNNNINLDIRHTSDVHVSGTAPIEHCKGGTFNLTTKFTNTQANGSYLKIGLVSGTIDDIRNIVVNHKRWDSETRDNDVIASMACGENVTINIDYWGKPVANEACFKFNSNSGAIGDNVVLNLNAMSVNSSGVKTTIANTIAVDVEDSAISPTINLKTNFATPINTVSDSVIVYMGKRSLDWNIDTGVAFIDAYNADGNEYAQSASSLDTFRIVNATETGYASFLINNATAMPNIYVGATGTTSSTLRKSGSAFEASKNFLVHVYNIGGVVYHHLESLTDDIADRPVFMTEAEFKAAKNNNELVAGQKYKVTGATSSDIDMIVRAISANSWIKRVELLNQDFDYGEFEYDSGTDIAIVRGIDELYGIIRNTSGTWGFITTGGHKLKGFSTIAPHPTVDGIVRLTYEKTDYNEVGYFDITPDETYSENGYKTGGPSMGLQYIDVRIERDFTASAYVYSNGTSFTIISKPTNFFTVDNYTSGVLTINHAKSTEYVGSAVPGAEDYAWFVAMDLKQTTTTKLMWRDDSFTKHLSSTQNIGQRCFITRGYKGLVPHADSDLVNSNFQVSGKMIKKFS